ncbi:DUF4199 domain-containing protein [Spongiimicrobium salis]|uniref:DUF4199 domain-containing protein n=1 Tax=Spongiimicrobium salis TaxID=1667022 RepID=UPI00374DBB31
MDQSKSLYKFTWIYGLILGGLPTLYHMVIYGMGLHLDYGYYGERLGEAYTQARGYLLPLLLFIALYTYRKANENSLRLKEGMMIGLWIFLIGSIVVIGYNLVFRLLLEPDFSAEFYALNRGRIFNELLEGHLELGRDYTQEDMDNHVQTNGNLWISFSVNLVLNLLFTAFFSFVFGLLLKRKKAVTD